MFNMLRAIVKVTRPCSHYVPVPVPYALALKRTLFRLLGAQGAIIVSLLVYLAFAILPPTSQRGMGKKRGNFQKLVQTSAFARTGCLGTATYTH